MKTNPRILVADDDSGVRELLVYMLKMNGAEVVAVADGAEAFAAASRSVFDACILDVEMPGMDGMNACRHLRDLPATAALPVLFLTGRTDNATIDKAFAAGASDYLPKPANATLLWSRLSHLLQLAELEEENLRLRDGVQALRSSK